MAAFHQMAKRGIYFLSRLLVSIALFDRETGTPLSLLVLLQEEETIDQSVVCAKERMPVRLVARPVSTEMASARREEAKTDRDRRAKHSAEYMALLGWEIFITNVPNTRSTTQVCQANTSRWRNETVFKF